MEHGGTAARIGFCCVVAGAGAMASIAACTDGPGIQQITLGGLSQAFCEKAVECGCAPVLSDFGFVPPPSCDGWNLGILVGGEGGYDEYGGDGAEYGYEGGNGDDAAGGDITHNFDPECADKLAAAISATSCDRLIPELACDDYCHLYYGTRFEGQPCNDEKDCAQGLVCPRECNDCPGECRDPCKIPTAGEGELCEFADCEDGLQCVQNDDDGYVHPYVCVPIGGEQDFCGEQICAPTAFCDFSDPTTPRCREPGDVGAACTGHAQCTTYYCPAGFCAELPGEGEPCTTDGECRSGALCGQSETDPQGTCFSIAPMCIQLFVVPLLVQGYDPYYYY